MICFNRKLQKTEDLFDIVKTLIITASSKSKKRENETPYILERPSFLDNLQKKYKNKMLDSRRELRKMLNIPFDEDLGDGTESSGHLKYLPAYRRYAGRTYSRISPDAWNVLNQNPEQFDCVILSALYGFIRYCDPIQDYLIKQVDKLPDGKRISNFWKTNGASDWIMDYIKNGKFDSVQFVLSTSYSDIIKKNQLIEKLTDLNVVAEDRQFKEAGGMKSMLVRGQFIDDLLLN